MEVALLLQAARAAGGLVSKAVDHCDVQWLRKRAVELRVRADECLDAALRRADPLHRNRRSTSPESVIRFSGILSALADRRRAFVAFSPGGAAMRDAALEVLGPLDESSRVDRNSVSGLRPRGACRVGSLGQAGGDRPLGAWAGNEANRRSNGRGRR